MRVIAATLGVVALRVFREIPRVSVRWQTRTFSSYSPLRKGVVATSMFLGGATLLSTTSLEGQEPMSVRMERFVKDLQQEIVAGLQEAEGSDTLFRQDKWVRPEGGDGISCVLQNGKVFEKAGVMVSVVHGKIPPEGIKQMRSRGHELPVDAPLPFFAAGISLVVHPHNPHAPTVHLNYRYFEVTTPSGPKAWFGGGADLTPSYIYDEDCTHFHKTLKAACDAHDTSYYPKLKQHCDEYFLIPHRGERRGIGGIFFDDFDEPDLESAFSFVQSCGRAFLPAYLPLINKRKNQAYTEEEKEWQQIRRGRYVEFNLVYDRGTKFGLATPGARIESVLVSLPLTSRWEYCHTPAPGSREEQALKIFQNPKDWA